MLSFRPKPGSTRCPEWTCCMCMHVRTATIMLGVWHLMLHLMALAILVAIVKEPRLLDEIDDEMDMKPEWSDVAVLPTPLSNIDQSPNTFSQRTTRDHTLLYLCTLAITLMLVYGAARGKPAHLLPFFCLQLFEFAITVLTATGYLCYLRSIHSLVAETPRVPWRGALLSLPAPALALIVLVGFLTVVLLKGYCISIVWRCYKYLTLQSQAVHSLRRAIMIATERPPPPAAPLAAPAPDYSTLLPDYEEAVKQAPPPSYQAAVLMHPDAPAAELHEPTAVLPRAPAPAAAAAPAPDGHARV